MPHFPSYDSTSLAYRIQGAGPPLVCLPGGPARASAYLGDLGGLSTDRTLIMLDNRGTGESAVPDSAASYRCDRIVNDVEAFRIHLGLERMDLLAHAEGGNVAMLYAARHPERLSRLVLVTPSLKVTGLPAVGAEEARAARSGEWWYPTARDAMDKVSAAMRCGTPMSEVTDLLRATAPFKYGRWDERARAHYEADGWEQFLPAVDGFYAGYTPDVTAVRRGLVAFDTPVLVLAGERDSAPTPRAAANLAALFPHARVAVQSEGGHHPWVDDPGTFRRTVRNFLAGRLSQRPDGPCR